MTRIRIAGSEFRYKSYSYMGTLIVLPNSNFKNEKAVYFVSIDNNNIDDDHSA